MTREHFTLAGRELAGGNQDAAGRPDPASCAALALRVLSDAAAPLPLSSVTVEMAAGQLEADAEVICEMRVDKRTRAVAFTTLEARSGGELLFVARALFTSGV